jgi:hypothetical protein
MLRVSTFSSPKIRHVDTKSCTMKSKTFSLHDPLDYFVFTCLILGGEKAETCIIYVRRSQFIYVLTNSMRVRDGVVVKALRYKSAGRGFDSRWCHRNFSVT